jgi:hypothetical protein
LQKATELLTSLFEVPWYREHLRSDHDNVQEVISTEFQGLVVAAPTAPEHE